MDWDINRNTLLTFDNNPFDPGYLVILGPNEVMIMPHIVSVFPKETFATQSMRYADSLV